MLTRRVRDLSCHWVRLLTVTTQKWRRDWSIQRISWHICWTIMGQAHSKIKIKPQILPRYRLIQLACDQVLWDPILLSTQARCQQLWVREEAMVAWCLPHRWTSEQSMSMRVARGEHKQLSGTNLVVYHERRVFQCLLLNCREGHCLINSIAG